MNRVILINKTKSPTREELVSSERRTGELLFAKFPNLQWAGYIVTEGYGRLSANWVIPDESVEEFCDFAETIDPEGYEVAVFVPGSTPSGGQCETRII